MNSSGKFTNQEIDEIVGLGYLNSFFAFGRSIGLMWHIIGQKMLKSHLHRHPLDAVLIMLPKKS